MLKDKHFWIGFLLAYGVALVFPPNKIMSLGKGGKGKSGA